MQTQAKTKHRILVTATLALSLLATACFPPEFRDAHGNPYRHEKWHDEHVYLREDGRWHARRHGDWVPVEGVRFDDRR